mgnify:CR=1 FL=1|jgi:hypothetical protein
MSTEIYNYAGALADIVNHAEDEIRRCAQENRKPFNSTIFKPATDECQESYIFDNVESPYVKDIGFKMNVYISVTEVKNGADNHFWQLEVQTTADDMMLSQYRHVINEDLFNLVKTMYNVQESGEVETSTENTETTEEKTSEPSLIITDI